MATADLTVIALGSGEPSASRYIAETQRRLAAQGRVSYVVDERRDREQTREDKVASVRRRRLEG